jgi:kinesin family protein 6/9
MSKNAAIEIFLRVKPSKKKSDKFHLLTEDQKAVFTNLKQMKKGEYINNTKNEYNYCFNGVFDMNTKQEQVFEHVAKDVIDNAFEGYNGTIFAYGQTGSGKTYTMTGPEERYSERGIIPRSVAYIFSEANRRTDSDFNIHISYLEIYNNDGYDLLSEDHSSKQLSDLPKVVPLERGTGELVLSGLSSHRVAKEEDAFNLLFIGDTNRMVCETPMNDASTRSHCIFIISIESCKHGSDVKTVSKVHLVDLSGSERVGKTGVNGTLLKEACFINLSLHYLEQVINSLQKKMNAAEPDQYFVPYRNSLMTMVLRDSLGGNCKTRMVSTIHVEEDFIDESISTCNFAMRVAMIKNIVTRNEAIDPNIIIQRLKRENQELKAEIAMLRGGQAKTELSGEDVARCQKLVQDFVGTRDPTQKLALSDPLMIHQCFYELKQLFISKQPSPVEVTKEKVIVKEDTDKVRRLEEEIAKLKMILKQRENEIGVFVNLISKNATTIDSSPKPISSESEPKATTREREIQENMQTLRQTQELRFPEYSKRDEDKNYQLVYSVVKENGDMVDYRPSSSKQAAVLTKTSQKPSTGEQRLKKESEAADKLEQSTSMTSKTADQSREMREINRLLLAPLNVTREQLMNRQACFEMFRKSYRKSEALQADLSLLEELSGRGKKLSEEVKTAKARLDSLKNSIEDVRRAQALQGMKQGGDWVRSPEEDRLLGEVQTQKRTLQEAVDRVKGVKEEILGVQINYEQAVKRMKADFDRWLMQMMVEQGLNKPKTELATTASALNETVGGVNSSMTSKTSNIRSEQVKKDLEAFYKAKEELYTKANKM